MVYAQIKNNEVKNTIVLNDDSLLPVFSQNWDHCIRIDELRPMPGIGWSYDGQEFAPPPPEEIEE